MLLVGGYDGSGNYGDVLQLATAIETVRRLPGSPLPVAVVELETRAHHAFLKLRYGAQLGEAAFVHYSDGGEAVVERLVELEPGAAPARSVLYLYGGGYLNHRWGARKVAHAAAAERLAGRAPFPVAASGLQLDEPTVVLGGAGHALLARASWVGVRDVDSLRHARSGLGAATADRIDLTGDDAVPFLHAESPPSPDPVVNLHLNDGVWVSEDFDATMRSLATFLCRLGRSAGVPLELQPVIAYEDPRVSERRVFAMLMERHGDELREAGLLPAEPLDVLEDATGHRLARFSRGRLTVSCSYHVTLTSLFSGIPAVFFAENDYYEQKAAGLRDLFDLDPGLLGVSGASADAAMAAEAALDGDTRAALVEHLRTRSRELVSRYERGREALTTALLEGLRSSPARAHSHRGWGRAARRARGLIAAIGLRLGRAG